VRPLELDVDGNGTRIQIEDERGEQLKHDHHVAMVNLTVQTTIAEINNKDKKQLVAKLEKKVNGNNGNTCSHDHKKRRWFARLFKKHSKETPKSSPD